jgi:hypothetical protein
MRTIPRTTLCVIALTAAAAAGALGCGASADGSATGEQPESTAQDLYLGGGVRTWSGGVVPVCYSGADGNNPALLAQAQQILNTYGWPVVANVQFTGWGECDTSVGGGQFAFSPQVQLHFSAGSNGLTAFDGEGNPISLGGFGADQWQRNDVYLVSDDPTGSHFQYEVLHEFGHVLGWDHEQQRPDNWSNGSEIFCTSNQSGQGVDNNGKDETSYFDTESIMSYCSVGSSFPQQLSPGDVAGVQAVYGRPVNVPSRGITGSNNGVSRTPNSLDTFFVHSDGSVWTNFWSPSTPRGNWPSFQLPGDGRGAAPDDAPVAVVSRSPLNIDIFFAGNDGAVHSSFWNPSFGWGSSVLPGTAGLVSPGQQIAAVSSSPGAIDVLFASSNGSTTGNVLYWTHWSGQCGSGATTTCGWPSAPTAIGSPLDTSIPPAAAVTAVARTPDRLDVFYIGNDSVPHTTYCTGFGTSGYGSCTPGNFIGSFPLPGCSAPAGSSIVATARSANNIDLFYPSSFGNLCTSFWSRTAGWQGFQIVSPGPGVNGQIAAMARTPNNLDLFWNDPGGRGMVTAWWFNGAAGWGSALIGNAPGGGQQYAVGGIGAAARTSNNLDAFQQIDRNGQTSGQETLYWSASSGWNSYQNDSY